MIKLAKFAFLFLVLLAASACSHTKGGYKQSYSVPILPIENSPLKISIVDGVPVAILDGKVISEPAEFPVTFVPDNKEENSISIRSIEQFTLIKVKGSCFYFACAGSSCTKFAVPDSYCR